MTKFAHGNFRAAHSRPEVILKIRELYERGATQRQLAAISGYSITQIGRIVRNEAWKAFKPTLTDEELEAAFGAARSAAGEPPASVLAESQARLFERLGRPPEPEPTRQPPEEWAAGIRRLHASLRPDRSLDLPVSPEKASILALRTGKDPLPAAGDPRIIASLIRQTVLEANK
jgi:hypothetical protein